MLLLPLARGPGLVCWCYLIRTCRAVLWWRYPGSALLLCLGNALCLVSCRGFVQHCQAWLPPSGKQEHVASPASAVLCHLCHCSICWGNKGSQDCGFGAQFGLLKGKSPESFLERNGAVAMYVRPDQSAGVWVVPSEHGTDELEPEGCWGRAWALSCPLLGVLGPCCSDVVTAASLPSPGLKGRAAAGEFVLLLQPIDWTFQIQCNAEFFFIPAIFKTV